MEPDDEDVDEEVVAEVSTWIVVVAYTDEERAKTKVASLRHTLILILIRPYLAF
jgi:hypothetical protein